MLEGIRQRRERASASVEEIQGCPSAPQALPCDIAPQNMGRVFTLLICLLGPSTNNAGVVFIVSEVAQRSKLGRVLDTEKLILPRGPKKFICSMFYSSGSDARPDILSRSDLRQEFLAGHSSRYSGYSVLFSIPWFYLALGRTYSSGLKFGPLPLSAMSYIQNWRETLCLSGSYTRY